MLTVQEFLEGFLVKWETKKHSLDPDDSGNWFKGQLVGSKYGVTGAALAKHRDVASVTREDVSNVTLAEAATIARTVYYDEAQFDLLPWGPVVASAVDKCYMSGPNAAVLCIQRAAGTKDDGHIGPNTVKAVATAALGQEAFAQRMADERAKHETLVIKAKPVKAKYRNGWNNRSKSYLPGTSWWKSWQLDAIEQPVDEYAASRPPLTERFPELAEAVASPLEQIVVEKASEVLDKPVKEVAKELSRTTVTEVLAKAPPTVLEHVSEAAKLKLGEKSTWIGGALVVATTLADPTVQAAIRPTWAAIKSGNFGGILAGVIGLGLVLARSRSTPRADAVIAAKRITGNAP